MAMKFRVPFTFSSLEILKKKSRRYGKRIKYKKHSRLGDALHNCEVHITRKEYLSIVRRSFVFNLIFLSIFLGVFLGLLRVASFIIIALGVAFAISGFIMIIQRAYPGMFVQRRQRNIERNLLPALEDILVQLNSGIPLFSVLVNISASDYGQLSEEFKKAVKKINAGAPEQQVLEELSKRNPSAYFKRTLWQISNGMNAGSNMTIVVRDSIKALSEEQVLQIQNYGNKLNPLMVFYMLAAVIVPALSITFLTILSSMVNLPAQTTQYMFIGLFVGVMFIQIMFLGLIKSRRPSLL